MIENCKQEIIELHQFFEKWLNGTVARSDKSLSRVTEALDEDFMMITPNANQTVKSTLMDNLKKGHAVWNNGTINIKNMKARPLTESLCLVVYEEWQNKGGESVDHGRLSSALFRKAGRAPCGVKWVHLHEVWME